MTWIQIPVRAVRRAQIPLLVKPRQNIPMAAEASFLLPSLRLTTCHRRLPTVDACSNLQITSQHMRVINASFEYIIDKQRNPPVDTYSLVEASL
jgi:hypothetical protein